MKRFGRGKGPADNCHHRKEVKLLSAGIKEKLVLSASIEIDFFRSKAKQAVTVKESILTHPDLVGTLFYV